MAADRHAVGIQTEPGRAAIRCKLKVGLKCGIVRRWIGRRVGVPVHREASDHRPEYLGLALNGAVAVPAPLILFRAAVERPVRCDLVAGAVRRIKERDNCVAHALVLHKAPARVGLLGLCAGAFPFRLRFVKALLEFLCVEVGAGVVAGVPELRPRIARPGGDRRIEVVAAVARNEPRLALVGAAVAVRRRVVQQVGNEHLRQIKPRVVDIEVVQVILFLSAVAASVVPQPVVAGIGADDLIAGLLAAGVVQDGEIVRSSSR